MNLANISKKKKYVNVKKIECNNIVETEILMWQKQNILMSQKVYS